MPNRINLKSSLEDISIDSTDLMFDIQDSMSYEEIVRFIVKLDENIEDIDFTEMLILSLIKNVKIDDPDTIKGTLAKIKRAVSSNVEPKKITKSGNKKRKAKTPEQPATRFNQIDIVIGKDGVD